MPKTEQLKAKMAEQRKISLDERCNTDLQNPVLKEGMADLIAFLYDLKMKPRWYHHASYKCYFKKEIVVYINLYQGNCKIVVCTSAAENVFGRGNVSAYINELDSDVKAEFISRLKPCVNCLLKDGREKMCKGGHDIEIDGVVNKGICCHSLFYIIKNPTAEQFQMVKKFITARRNFLEVKS